MDNNLEHNFFYTFTQKCENRVHKEKNVKKVLKFEYRKIYINMFKK